jgi:hypothetical protein
VRKRAARNVKRWSSGETALGWTAAGMLEAERRFRRIVCYRQLAVAIAGDLATSVATKDVATLAPA